MGSQHYNGEIIYANLGCVIGSVKIDGSDRSVLRSSAASQDGMFKVDGRHWYKDVTISPGGKWAAFASVHGEVFVRSVSGASPKDRWITGNRGSIEKLAWLNKGKWLAVHFSTGIILVYSPEHELFLLERRHSELETFFVAEENDHLFLRSETGDLEVIGFDVPDLISVTCSYLVGRRQSFTQEEIEETPELIARNDAATICSEVVGWR